MNSDTEILRSALLEIEHLRAREALARAENALLLRILGSVRRHTSIEGFVREALSLLIKDIGADVALVVSLSRSERRALITVSTAPDLVNETWQPAASMFDRQRYFADLRAARVHTSLPEKLLCFAGWLSAPLGNSSGVQEALVCLSSKPGFAGPEDVKRFGLATSLLSQLLKTKKLESQNQRLADLLSRERLTQSPTGAGANPSPGFEAIDAALRNLTIAQNEVVEILGDLLRVNWRDIDDAIRKALPGFGEALGLHSLETYVRGTDKEFARLYTWGEPSLGAKDSFERGMIEHFEDRLVLGTPFIVTHNCRDFGARIDDATAADEVYAPFASENGVFGFVRAVSLGRATIHAGELSLLRLISSVVGGLLLRKEHESQVSENRAELELQSHRLRTTLDALPDLVMELDGEGRLTNFYSERMSTLVDDPSAFIGLLPEDILPPAVSVRVRKVFDEVKSGASAAQTEFYLHLRGQKRWFSFIASTRSSGLRERGYGFLAVARDITEEKRKIEEIERLSTIAQRTSNLVIITNASREIVWVNDAFERRTGYALSEVVGLHPGSVLQGEQTDPATIQAIRSALDSGIGIQCEVLNYDRSGAPYWVEMDIQPTRDASGGISGYMAVQADITERRQQLDNLVLSEKRARADLATATDASRDGIAVTDDQGNFVYMNIAHRDMFAVPSGFDIIGAHWSVLYAEDKAQFINEKVFPILVAKGGWKGEIAGRRFDGNRVEQEVSLTLKEDGGIVCITRDIGERLKAEADRTRLSEALQLAQRREALSQMAAGLAHDFNNLIAAIAGSAALIEADSIGAAAEHARRISLATQRASELVQRLLARGARRPANQKVPISGIIRESADLLRAGLKSGTLLQSEVSGPDLTVEADPTDLLQVLLNLVLNARDALTRKKDNGTISISARWAQPDDMLIRPDVGSLEPTATYLLLEVSDNGCGMDANDRSKVFEPYFTTKGDGGSGLGLVIVSSVVDANSGALVLESSPNVGTSVKVFWPKFTMPLSVDKQTIENTQTVPANLEGHSVLLVDDNEDVLDVLTIFFEKAGAEVAAVSDPAIALEAIQESPELWNILLTDFDMPGMTGAELARRAKAVRPEIPVILMTGFPDWRSRTTIGTEKVFKRVVSKPLAPESLVALVADTLKESAG